MKYVAWPAARLALLVSALAFSALPLRADELQDIDRHAKQGQHAKAFERVNRYLAQTPRDPKGRFIKGLILAEQNKGAEAIEVFTALSRDYPELPEPYNNLAVLYAAQGQYEKARQQLEMSIRTHPSYATAYENLGDVYTKLASQAYDKALQFDSSNSAAKNKLSLVRDLMSSNRAPRASSASSGTSPEPVQPPAAKTTTAKATEVKAAAGQAKPAATRPAEKQTQATKGEARSQWEAARRQRISAPKKIDVAIESPKVVLKGENDAVVSFRQVYRSDSLKVNSRKTLVMVRREGRWLIQQEGAGA